MPCSAPPPHNLPLADEFRYLQGEDPLRDAIGAVNDGVEQISNLAQLTKWVRGPLRSLIPHGKTPLGFGHADYSTLKIERVHAVDIAEDYFATTHPNSPYLRSPVLANWLQWRVPQIIHPNKICPRDEHRWHANFKWHPLQNAIFDATLSCYAPVAFVSSSFSPSSETMQKWRRVLSI